MAAKDGGRKMKKGDRVRVGKIRYAGMVLEAKAIETKYFNKVGRVKFVGEDMATVVFDNGPPDEYFYHSELEIIEQ